MRNIDLTCAWCGVSFQRLAAYVKYRNKLGQLAFCCSKTCSAHLNPRGYRKELPPTAYRYITTPDGRVIHEHRYVMELAIGRPLRTDEKVHHKNENRSDNRLENLEILSHRAHQLEHGMRNLSWDYEAALKLRAQGLSYRKIAKALGVKKGDTIRMVMLRHAHHTE